MSATKTKPRRSADAEWLLGQLMSLAGILGEIYRRVDRDRLGPDVQRAMRHHLHRMLPDLREFGELAGLDLFYRDERPERPGRRVLKFTKG